MKKYICHPVLSILFTNGHNHKFFGTSHQRSASTFNHHSTLAISLYKLFLVFFLLKIELNYNIKEKSMHELAIVVIFMLSGIKHGSVLDVLHSTL